MSAARQLFSQKDRDLIQSLVYDASLKPGFNALSSCLYWEDERPLGVSREGYDLLATLWMDRSLMHQGLTFEDNPVNPALGRRIWQQATEEIPDWPGFKRLVLNHEDKTFLKENLARKGFH